MRQIERTLYSIVGLRTATLNLGPVWCLTIKASLKGRP